jgi:hypothetical protein
MKKLFFLTCFTLYGTIILAQAKKIDFPITGTWYSPKTNQLFAFQADKDATIKGRGVYYGNGTGKMVQMQIMSQQEEIIESGENAYYLLTYDPAKPKTIYKLVTYPGHSELVLKMTEPNNPKKTTVIFYALKDLEAKNKHLEDN